MTFTPTPLAGAFVVGQEPRTDERGHFARTFCAHEFTAQGLATSFVQSNVSVTSKRGCIRGLHFQRAPHAEVKLVRCARGAAYDVIVDLRPSSPTFGAWFGCELSARNGSMMYAPEGFAHGFQTLTDDVEINYQVSAFYAPASEHGLRFDDPQVGIRWPERVTLVSARDRRLPLLNELRRDGVLPEFP